MLKIVSIFTTLGILFSTGYVTGEQYNNQTNACEIISVLFNKDEIVDEYHTGTVSDYKWSKDEVYDASYGTTVYKDADKDFTVLNIADIHFSDFGTRVFTSVFSEATVRRLVAQYKPDLITLTGDNVCNVSTYFSIRRLTDLMESFGIPWAPVFGNHDDEGNCDLNFLADIMMTSPHCLMKKGDPGMGVGNYVVNVAEKNDDGTERIVETIVMMDSHHSQANELQQKWYKWVCEGVNNITNSGSEITLVQHIPLPEYQYAYDELHGSSKWDEASGGAGQAYERICCERDSDGNPVQRGFFDVIKNSGTKYVFCGHEHRNDFSVEYEGVRLTYCLKVGKASGFQFGFDGGTIIKIGKNGINGIAHCTETLFGFRDILNLGL